MAERTFELPDLGEGIAEGELVSWLVAPGEVVEEDRTIAEVETDKALVEIPSPYDGTVTQLHYEEGEMVPVDSVIATFEVDVRGGNGGSAEVDARGGHGNTAEVDARGGNGGSAEVDDGGDGGDATTAEGDHHADEASATDTGTGGSTTETGETRTGVEGNGQQAAAAEGDDEPAVPDGRVFAAPTTRTLARELGVDLAAVDGSDAGGRITEADVRAAAAGEPGPAEAPTGEGPTGEAPAEAAGDGAAGGRQSGAADEPSTTGGASGGGGGAVQVERDGADRERTLAMPATRRLAAEAGVDLNDVPASEERDGEAFVTPEDVRAHVESGGSASGAAASGGTIGSTTASAVGNGAAAGGATSGERVPYRGVRRTIGEQMARSKYTAPHVSHHDEFDASELVEVRAELAEAAAREGVKLTYLPFVIKAVTAALREFPYLNSSLDEEAGEIVLHDEYNVGIAVATDAGLMVPVVKHADRKGLREIASEVRDLAERARDRTISPEEMRGGTFTVTNVGVIGGEFSSPIINHPEAAILAMGPIAKRPWVVGDEVVARETMRFSMSVDHRLVDGADAARFSNRVKEYLANPALLLLD